MSSEIINEVDVFFKAIMLGALFAFIYDIIRIMRRVVFKSFIIIGLEDIIYWLIIAVMTCMFLYKVNGGVIRSYIIAGVVIGMILYELSLGRFIVKYLSIAIRFVVEKIRKLLVKIWKILYWGLKKVFKPIKILVRKLNVKRFRKTEKIKKPDKVRKGDRLKRGAGIEKEKRKKKITQKK